MQKTVYQTPELRDANDNIIQEGAFGKNTALSNSTNDGWIDYVVNNLEALHDTIGDSAATLDGNGHVVEPANYAIGDEDGNRLKTSYLKLTGGTVAGTLNVRQALKIQDNQENVFGGFYVPSSSSSTQYLSIYGGENASAGNASIVLRPSGDGRFQINGYNTDGSATYQLASDNNGNLLWRGYPLAWKKDYLPLSGGTMTGWLSANASEFRIRNSKAGHDGMVSLVGGEGTSTGASLYIYGVSHSSQGGRFHLSATDGTNTKTLIGRPDGTLTWDGNAIALAKDYLPLAGGTMTNSIKFSTNVAVAHTLDTNYLYFYGGTPTANSGARLTLTGKNHSWAGQWRLEANDGTNVKTLIGGADGTLTWNAKTVQTSATFVQQAVETTYSLNGNASSEFYVSIVNTGYVPIAIAGLRTYSQNICPMQWWIQGSEAHAYLRNLTSTAVSNGRLVFYILYAKA